MNLKVIWTSKFKKDYKLAIKRGLNINLLDDAIKLLAKDGSLPEKYSDHALQGEFKGSGNVILNPIGYSFTLSKITSCI